MQHRSLTLLFIDGVSKAFFSSSAVDRQWVHIIYCQCHEGVQTLLTDVHSISSAVTLTFDLMDPVQEEASKSSNASTLLLLLLLLLLLILQLLSFFSFNLSTFLGSFQPEGVPKNNLWELLVQWC